MFKNVWITCHHAWVPFLLKVFTKLTRGVREGGKLLVYISWLFLWWLRSTYITCLKGNKLAAISCEYYWRYNIYMCFKVRKNRGRLLWEQEYFLILFSPNFHENPTSCIIPKTFKAFGILRLNVIWPENEFTYLIQRIFSVVENWRFQIFFFLFFFFSFFISDS